VDLTEDLSVSLNLLNREELGNLMKTLKISTSQETKVDFFFFFFFQSTKILYSLFVKAQLISKIILYTKSQRTLLSTSLQLVTQALKDVLGIIIRF